MKKEKQACSWEDHLKTGLGPATWTRTPFKPGSTKLTHIAVEPAPPFGRSPTFLRMEGRLCLSWLMYNEEYPRLLQGCSQMGSRRPWGHLTLDDAQNIFWKICFLCRDFCAEKCASPWRTCKQPEDIGPPGASRPNLKKTLLSRTTAHMIFLCIRRNLLILYKDGVRTSKCSWRWGHQTRWITLITCTPSQVTDNIRFPTCLSCWAQNKNEKSWFSLYRI
ncbi:unnamed protein product, partial [Nesidiocoris tenuis]